MRRYSRYVGEWGRMLLRHRGWLRYAWPWFASNRPGRSPLADGVPWVTYPAIRWLESFLHREMRVWEWGSGGSTLFLARRVRSLISIEHHDEWFNQVRDRLREQDVCNVDCRLIAPDGGLLPAPPPAHASVNYGSGARGYEGKFFHSYVCSIDAEPAASLGLVMIDGRARMACLFHALAKVRHGGAVMLDNAHYARYQDTLTDLENTRLRKWKRVDLSGPGPYTVATQGTTLAWIRPDNGGNPGGC